jgi:hypothetical protein
VRKTLLLLGLVVAFFSMAVGASAHSSHYLDGYRHCGPVHGATGGTIWISAKRVSCARARRIDREFYFGPEDRKRHHGDETIQGSWWTLKRYPGWRCGEGTGGGSCHKHGATAFFSTL